MKAEAPWELLQAKVAEGPSVLKKNGTYYLIYSANHYQNKGYGVGYATSKSPMGPWIKYSKNPLLQGVEGMGLVGTHGMARLFNAKMAAGNTFSMPTGAKRKYIRVLPISRISLSQIREWFLLAERSLNRES